jgi:hypothetical protein
MAFNADVAGEKFRFFLINVLSGFDWLICWFFCRKQLVRHSIEWHRKKAQKLSTPSCSFRFSHRSGFLSFWWWFIGYRVPRFHGNKIALYQHKVESHLPILIANRSNYGAFQSVDCQKHWRRPSVSWLVLISVE